MDSIRGVLRSGLWLCFLLCVLSVASHSNAATRKSVTIPTAQSVATSPGSGVPIKSGSTLSIPGAAQGEYIPFEPGSRKVPLKVIPTIDYSIPRTINAAKGLLKNNAASILIGGTIAALLAGVDMLIEDGKVVKRKEGETAPTAQIGWNPSGGLPPVNSRYSDPVTALNTWGSYFCQSSFTNCYTDNHHRVSDTRWEATAHRTRTGTGSTPEAYTIKADLLGTCPPGYTFQSPTGKCTSNQTTTEPASDADFDAIDPYVSGQTAEWIHGLLRESCSGSNAPGRCFEDLKDNVSLSGPSTVTGPATSTSSTYTKPDGTVGTKSSNTTTNYKVTYGPTYFDFSKTQTTIWNEDGQQVGEETVTENDDIEAEEPAEEPKEEEVASPCDGSICDGPAYEDLYSPTDVTKEDHLDSYSDRISGIPIIAAAGSLFDVSISAGACPTWSYNGNLDLGIASMPIDLVFDYLCLPWFVDYKPWIQAIILLGFTLVAIRIGIL
jgi:hypothetical protein